jgi:tetratricopeptide (TPR) repeat protein
MKKTLLITAFFMLVSIFSFAQTSAEGYFDRGLAKYALKDYRGAIQDLNKAIELDPSYAYAYYNRGVIKHFLNDIDGACLDWSKAGELGAYVAYDRIKEYCN